MKNTIAITLIFLTTFFANTFAQKTGWEVVQSNTTEDLNSIYFYDYQFGFAVGNSGVILKSIDSGKTWQSLQSPISIKFNDCYMFDQNCFMAVGDSEMVITTYDSGNTWYSWLTNGQTEDIYCVSFCEAQGISSGIFGRDSLMIWYGENYYCTTVILEELGGNEIGSFRDAQIFTYEVAFIVGENSASQLVFGRTTNGIYAWEFDSFYLDGKEGRATGVAFTDIQNGFISAIVWEGGGAIAKTIDNGDNWTTKFFSHSLHSISFPISGTSQVGYCVGDSGAILKTLNAGENWNYQISPSSERLNKVFFIDQNFGFAVGDNGTILRTTVGGGPVTSVDNDLTTVNKFELQQNYPNPFNPSTTIRYSIPTTSQVTIKVFDILGNEIETLVNEEKSAGNYEVEFNAKRISSGIYFYQLTAGNPSTSSGQVFVQTRKMILLK